LRVGSVEMFEWSYSAPSALLADQISLHRTVPLRNCS
jgi:hypothetical protein